MTVAVLLACLGCVLALAAACGLLHIAIGLLGEVRDQLKVLRVAVYGLEAKAIPAIENARESADATVVVASELKKSMDDIVMSPKARAAGKSPFDMTNPFGRVMAARELFAQAETASLEEVTKNG